MTEPQEDGPSPRDQILAAREKLRMLILGLANYLSHQFRAENGLIRHELQAKTQSPSPKSFSAMDQALALRALVRASQDLRNDIYPWEAVDILFSMNKELFDQAAGFYRSEGEPQLTPWALTQTLRALEAVRAHVPPTSQKQIDRIQAPWLERVQNWRLRP